MSTRFDTDCCDDGGSTTYGLWEANVRRAIAGRRGQQALLDLEAALLALPTKRLIAGALCAEGEVCAVGALGLKRLLDAGEGEESAYSRLEGVYSEDGDATARFGRTLGLTYTLAWEIAATNDEVFATMTPEARYHAMLRWVRSCLGREGVA
jgi:hypothetical protein